MNIILYKGASLNDVSPKSIKALNNENRLILFQIYSDFLDNDIEIEDLKVGNLKILKTGDSSNPNNWKGIDLLDVVSKLISIIINTRIQIA